ncbi:MAG: hypothetical protein IJ570_01795, partial [Prevotella sp.]|nr:hypothetical protein [Prevotella sp.]
MPDRVIQIIHFAFPIFINKRLSKVRHVFYIEIHVITIAILYICCLNRAHLVVKTYEVTIPRVCDSLTDSISASGRICPCVDGGSADNDEFVVVLIVYVCIVIAEVSSRRVNHQHNLILVVVIIKTVPVRVVVKYVHITVTFASVIIFFNAIGATVKVVDVLTITSTKQVHAIAVIVSTTTGSVRFGRVFTGSFSTTFVNLLYEEIFIVNCFTISQAIVLEISLHTKLLPRSQRGSDKPTAMARWVALGDVSPLVGVSIVTTRHACISRLTEAPSLVGSRLSEHPHEGLLIVLQELLGGALDSGKSSIFAVRPR